MAEEHDSRVIPRDSRGSPAFLCHDCGRPLSLADFHHMGLREPDPGETAADYMAVEVVDDLSHAECIAARQQAG